MTFLVSVMVKTSARLLVVTCWHVNAEVAWCSAQLDCLQHDSCYMLHDSCYMLSDCLEVKGLPQLVS